MSAHAHKAEVAHLVAPQARPAHPTHHMHGTDRPTHHMHGTDHHMRENMLGFTLACMVLIGLTFGGAFGVVLVLAHVVVMALHGVLP